MARTYDAEALALLDPQDPTWARNWLRFLLRDTPSERGGLPSVLGQQPTATASDWPEFSRSDEELNSALSMNAVGPVISPYYRPHVTAAQLYQGDPQLWKARAVDGTSESRRPVAEVVAAWLDQGRRIDALIPAEYLPVNPQTSPGGTLIVQPASVIIQPEYQDW